jgi:hypothetical protein
MKGFSAAAFVADPDQLDGDRGRRDHQSGRDGFKEQPGSARHGFQGLVSVSPADHSLSGRLGMVVRRGQYLSRYCGK